MMANKVPVIDYVLNVRKIAEKHGLNIKLDSVKELLDLLYNFQQFGNYNEFVKWKDRFDECIEAEFDDDCLTQPYPEVDDDDDDYEPYY